MGKIVVAGSLNMDLSVRTGHIPAAGETILGGGLLESPGGKGANQAFAAAKLLEAGEIIMLGCVGQDEFGKKMLAHLGGSGCDVSHLCHVAGPSGVALIVVSDQGENAIVVAPGANALFSHEMAQATAAVLDGADALLLQLEIPLDTVIALARQARQRGVIVILDPAPAPDHGLPRELLELIDIITPNETEASALTNVTAHTESQEVATTMASQLVAAGCGAVILKLGARGCLLFQAGKASYVPAAQVVAIDSTAAGDVFNGALAVALSEKAGLAEACSFATKAAAISVTRMGAQLSAPSRQEVNEFRG